MGAVGRAVARRLRAFDAQLLYTDPTALPAAEQAVLGARSVPLETLPAHNSAVVLTTPLSAATRHLIGPVALQRLPEGAPLVNVGRGSVVDENAVADALAAGHVGGYASDVFAFEDAHPRPHPVHPTPGFGLSRRPPADRDGSRTKRPRCLRGQAVLRSRKPRQRLIDDRFRVLAR
jgi:lactate dehydrogenase-like 2-hydroxyacid dehydrogenase